MNAPNGAVRQRSSAVRTSIIMVALASLAACSDDPVDTGKACVGLTSPIPSAAVSGLGDSELRAAVRDAADRNVAALPASAEIAELRTAVETLSQNLGSARRADACLAITKARAVLARQPDDPATLPDRAALQLVLDIAAAVIVNVD